RPRQTSLIIRRPHTETSIAPCQESPSGHESPGFGIAQFGLSNPPLILSNAPEPGAENHDPKRSKAVGHHGGDTSRGIRECQKADGQRDPADSGADQAHPVHNSQTAHVFGVVARPHTETSIPPFRQILSAPEAPLLFGLRCWSP